MVGTCSLCVVGWIHVVHFRTAVFIQDLSLCGVHRFLSLFLTFNLFSRNQIEKVGKKIKLCFFTCGSVSACVSMSRSKQPPLVKILETLRAFDRECVRCCNSVCTDTFVTWQRLV